jgi:hypothetical protein
MSRSKAFVGELRWRADLHERIRAQQRAADDAAARHDSACATWCPVTGDAAAAFAGCLPVRQIDGQWRAFVDALMCTCGGAA